MLILCLLLPQNLYESIKNEPFKIPEDDGNDLTHTFFNPDREGWLLKLGERAWRGEQMCAAVGTGVRGQGQGRGGVDFGWLIRSMHLPQGKKTLRLS